MKKIAVFVSGGGSNLQALMDAITDGYIKDASIVVVVSNKKEAYGLERAVKSGIDTLFLDPKDFKNAQEYDKTLAEKMNALKIDIVCLAGYMKILKPIFLEVFKGKVLNIHPALLPSFGGEGCYGLHVHEKVLEAGVKVTGVTVHFVDEGADTGPIILQKTVEVSDDDTPESLQKKVLKYEHESYKEALKYVVQDRVSINGKKTYIKPSGKI